MWARKAEEEQNTGHLVWTLALVTVGADSVGSGAGHSPRRSSDIHIRYPQKRVFMPVSALRTVHTSNQGSPNRGRGREKKGWSILVVLLTHIPL